MMLMIKFQGNAAAAAAAAHRDVCSEVKGLLQHCYSTRQLDGAGMP
jgi:hypothetical protein